MRDLSFVPSTSSLSSAVTEALALVPAGGKTKRVVVLGHSLGGHVAVDMAATAAAAGVVVDGVVLLASVCCRPHKALGHEHGYKVARWLGLNTHHPLVGGAVRTYLEFLYKRVLGFPKVLYMPQKVFTRPPPHAPLTSPQHVHRDEVVLTQRRVAHLDWERFTRQVRSYPSLVFGPCSALPPWTE